MGALVLWIWLSATSFSPPSAAVPSTDGTRLWGRVVTTDERTLEGFIRWDRNEASLADFLDAEKEIADEVLREAERLDPEYARQMRDRRSIVAFGMRIRWDRDDLSGPDQVASPIRFVHIASIEPVDARRAVVTLHDGSSMELVGTSTDLGAGMRQLVVERSGDEPVTLRWRELARVDFLPPPAEAGLPTSERIHGTLTTWGGHELTGWIVWDRDEALLSDVLDGREAGIDYEIEFADIESIEPMDRRSARVVLRSGVERVLRGTNDVDRTNRGIEVGDPVFGRAIVAWEDLRGVRFHPLPGYETRLRRAEPPTGPIRGTVHAKDGRVLRGTLRWGHDEAYLWEVLDGWIDDTQLQIEFGSIRTILPDGPDAVTVELVDGRSFRLEDSDDVGGAHRGVFVRPEGRGTRLIRWADIARVELDR